MKKVSQSPVRGRWAVLIVCVGIFAIGQFHRASGGVFSPILIDRLSVSATAVGTLVSAMFLANLAAQLPFGYALDRYGPRPVLILCLFVIALGTALFAFGGFRLDTLTASRVLIGLGLASMGAATHVIIARSFPSRDFGYISGLIVTLGGIGGLLGTYPLAFALERLPWELVFSLAAVAALLLVILVYLCLGSAVAPSAAEERVPSQAGYLTLLVNREFQKILVLYIVAYAPMTTIMGLWGGPYLQDVLGLSAEASGGILLAMFLTTVVAGYFFGFLDRNVSRRHRMILFAVAVSGGSLLVLSVIENAPSALAVGLLLLMIFSQQFYVPLGAHMRQIIPQNLMGRASTLAALFGVAGIPLMQTLFGLVLDAGGRAGVPIDGQYRYGFAMMGVLILLAGCVYAMAKEADPKEDQA